MELNVLVNGEDNVEKFDFSFENNNIKFNFITDNNESKIDAYILLYDDTNYDPKIIANMIESILNNNPDAYIYLGANKISLKIHNININFYIK